MPQLFLALEAPLEQLLIKYSGVFSVQNLFISCHYLGTVMSASFIIFMDVLISCSFSHPSGNFPALKS